MNPKRPYVWSDSVDTFRTPVTMSSVICSDEIAVIVGADYKEFWSLMSESERDKWSDLKGDIADLIESVMRNAAAPVTVQPAAILYGHTGHTCAKCKTFNEYAASNQPDGSYVCFGCRP